jgi:hypothetical protein
MTPTAWPGLAMVSETATTKKEAENLERKK